MHAFSLRHNFCAAAALLLALTSVHQSKAQVTPAPAIPQIGSPNTVTADPTVPRPNTQPCTVQLFQNLEFADFNNKPFTYAPPTNCPGPWAKVVFTADFTVTAGRQFDRTASFYLGHANIFYGTTAEPRSAISPSWHVERDVTDLSALFKSPQSGEAILGNFVGASGGVNYTGIIYANAALQFYPASFFQPAPPAPDVVVPLPDVPGGAATLNTTASQLSQSVTLPANTERVYLDVIGQSQIGDEFWYTCAPSDVANEVQSCGNTAFRETEVFVDNQPAGVAPIFPWIYTGGIDPYLWAPIPGVQTLNFQPYRVDLTPFAGLFADGQPHTVALSVYNANNYFLATANLLAYLDHGAKQVSGGLISNTLTAEPTPTVNENLTNGTGGSVAGTVTVASARSFAITGYLHTSHGRVETTVQQNLNFQNTQQYTIDANTYVQDITQATTVDGKTTTRNGPLVLENSQHISYPFTLNYAQVTNTDGSFAITTTVEQKDLLQGAQKLAGFTIYTNNLSNQVDSTDTLNFDSNGSLSGRTNRQSSQKYFSNNSLGQCYSRTLTSADGLLTSVNDGVGCPK